MSQDLGVGVRGHRRLGGLPEPLTLPEQQLQGLLVGLVWVQERPLVD